MTSELSGGGGPNLDRMLLQPGSTKALNLQAPS